MTLHHPSRRQLLLAAALMPVGARAGAHRTAPAYRFTDLGTLEKSFSFGLGLNWRGTVVGYCGVDHGMHWRATRWRNGRAVPLGPDGVDSRAVAVNKSGVAVGESNPPGMVEWHATLWDGDTTTDLGALCSGTSHAYGINAAGQVVGDGLLPGNTGMHAVMWQDGSIFDLGTAGGSSSSATAINAHGKVVGWSANARGEPHAALWHEGRVRDLGTLGGLFSNAAAINEHGQAVGYAQDERGRYRAALWEDGAIVDLGALAGNHGYASDIDNNGTVVGTSYLTRKPRNEDARGVIWVDRQIVDLNTLLDDATRDAGWIVTAAAEINDSGQIAGTARNTLTGRTRACLLSPA